MFKWKNVKKPVFCLAPMAEITTLPFRSICKEMGADIVFTPMISADAIIFNPKKTLKIVEFLPEEQPVIVQIFGYDGEKIAQAANIIQKKLKPAGIDINMGCPAPNITGNECGSGLLRDLVKTVEIVKIVRKKYKGQLSVKLRLGWRDYNIKEFCQKLEKIGVDALTIHGRTAKQKYTGTADWQPIYEIAKSVKIPVIGNGDVTNWKIAYNLLLNPYLAGIMIGRGALGNPWIFKELKTQKDIKVGKKELIKIIDEQTKRYIYYVRSSQKGVRSVRGASGFRNALATHFLSLSKHPSTCEKRAILEMRKHLGWYIKGFPGAQEIRKSAMKVEKYDDVKKVLKDLDKVFSSNN